MSLGEVIQLAKNQHQTAETNRLLKQQNKLLAEIKMLLEKKI